MDPPPRFQGCVIMAGVTVDIGTSKIVVRLTRSGTTPPIAERILPNPQSFAGSDIISRARYAAASSSQAKKLRAVTVEAIDPAIHDMLHDQTLGGEELAEVVVVGNTVMHHLFHGLELDSLLSHPYTPSSRRAIETSAPNAGLPSAGSVPCYSPAVIAAFVGSDASANLASAEVWEYTEPVLILDIGVNTEILLWDGEKLWVASVASGPAFEGMSFACGVEAGNGAIDTVSIDKETDEINYNVIGGGKASGICGSGVVSLLSEMLETNLLLKTGSINRELDNTRIKSSGSVRYFEITEKNQDSSDRDIYLTQPEIRDLQLAKSAVAAGIYAVMRECETSVSSVAEVHVTGSFGSSLDFEAAKNIGMLPAFENSYHVAKADGPSMGAAKILCEPRIKERCHQLTLDAHYVDLEHNRFFNRAFPVTRLFQPWSSLMVNMNER